MAPFWGNGVHCGVYFYHTAGVMGAPKIDDKAAWTPRVARKGLDGLLKNAVNGIRSMPARGGDPTITDEELTIPSFT